MLNASLVPNVCVVTVFLVSYRVSWSRRRSIAGSRSPHFSKRKEVARRAQADLSGAMPKSGPKPDVLALAETSAAAELARLQAALEHKSKNNNRWGWVHLP